MACVSPDGKPTETGMAMLAALNKGNSSPEDIAAETGRPLFRVRSGLRELLGAGLVAESGESYSLTEQGKSVL
jgi:predicted transcriptional regulator